MITLLFMMTMASKPMEIYAPGLCEMTTWHLQHLNLKVGQHLAFRGKVEDIKPVKDKVVAFVNLPAECPIAAEIVMRPEEAVDIKRNITMNWDVYLLRMEIDNIYRVKFYTSTSQPEIKE